MWRADFLRALFASGRLQLAIFSRQLRLLQRVGGETDALFGALLAAADAPPFQGHLLPESFASAFASRQRSLSSPHLQLLFARYDVHGTGAVDSLTFKTRFAKCVELQPASTCASDNSGASEVINIIDSILELFEAEVQLEMFTHASLCIALDASHRLLTSQAETVFSVFDEQRTGSVTAAEFVAVATRATGDADALAWLAAFANLNAQSEFLTIGHWVRSYFLSILLLAHC